jgi:hypothetical protein
VTAPPDPVATAWAALSRSAATAGCVVSLIEGDAAPWWSATFAGDAVWLTIAAGPDAARWLAALPDAELSIADRLVADCLVEQDARGRTTVSLLILDAG